MRLNREEVLERETMVFKFFEGNKEATLKDANAKLAADAGGVKMGTKRLAEIRELVLTGKSLGEATEAPKRSKKRSKRTKEPEVTTIEDAVAQAVELLQSAGASNIHLTYSVSQIVEVA